jgi:hypothetical protein
MNCNLSPRHRAIASRDGNRYYMYHSILVPIKNVSVGLPIYVRGYKILLILVPAEKKLNSNIITY